MSQNFNTGGGNTGGGASGGQGGQGSGGAGTGATDAGTTRAADAGTSTGATDGGGGQSLAASAGAQGTGTGAAGGVLGTVKEYGSKVADAATTAKDYVADRFTDLKNTDVREVANQAKDYARQNPGQAIMISAAAGLVLGLLIRGSRRS
ncbi:MAG TPA: hypothetical protein VF723_15590 [Pyrinomonadaceae bacterium]|jgi:hypothetical protein